MVWDASKSPGDLITSSDWNDMVSDQKGHASRHSDGGGDELDAADLSGGLGTSGQLLQSDGSSASWVDFSGGGITATAPLTTLASEEGITLFRAKIPSGKTVEVTQAVIADDNGDSVTNETEIELFNHTDGTTEYVVDTDVLQQGDPLYSGSQGDDIEVRLVNATSSQKNLTGQMLLNVK